MRILKGLDEKSGVSAVDKGLKGPRSSAKKRNTAASADPKVTYRWRRVRPRMKMRGILLRMENYQPEVSHTSTELSTTISSNEDLLSVKKVRLTGGNRSRER